MDKVLTVQSRRTSVSISSAHLKARHTSLTPALGEDMGGMSSKSGELMPLRDHNFKSKIESNKRRHSTSGLCTYTHSNVLAHT